MKRTLLVAAFGAAAFPLLAQISVGGTPVGLRMAMARTTVPTVHAAPFDAELVARENAEREQKHQLAPYGRSLVLNASLNDAGTWTDLPNGDRVWRLRVVSDGALATELYYEDFYMPSGAQLYVYDEEGAQLLGGFTSANNRASGLFTTSLIQGASCIVEYDEPGAVTGQGRFTIAKVGHAYRFVDAAAEGACEVDVNCSEGAAWVPQRDGVVRISVTENGVQGWCSGSLVNNVEQDCRAYFLTANHCGINPSTADYAQWKFYFKFQKPGCGTGDALAGSSVIGCTERAESNDNGGDSGSDYLLVEGDDAIPNNYNPFWCGWDASGNGSSSGVGIHHPDGAAKKISTYTTNLTSGTWWTVPNTHWRVNWAATANGHGVTEGGSSGSPLFNSAHRIIGTLTGGGSSCTSTSQQDLYGKMSYHWQSDPGPVSDKLKSWLDPNNTGTLTMDGSYGPCGTLGVHDVAAAETPGLYPNPAMDKVTVVYPAEVTKADRIDVLDVTGRVVKSFTPNTTGKAELDVQGWSAGTYLVRLVADGQQFGAARLNVTTP